MKKLKIYEDIRVFCTLLVVIGHCTSLVLFNKSGVPNLIFLSSINELTEGIRRIIYSFHMPLFVSLSGAVFSITIQRQKGLNDFVVKKFKRLLIPFITVGLFILLPVRIITGYYSDGLNFKNIIYDYLFTYDVNYLWYLIMLFEVENFFYLIYKCSRNRLNKSWLTIILLFISIVSFILPVFPFQINKVFEFGFWFYIGCLVSNNRRILSNDKLSLFALALVWIVTFVFFTRMEMIVMPYNRAVVLLLKLFKMVIRYIMEGSAIIFIYSFFLIFPLNNSILYRMIDSNSMAIYLLHCPLIFLYKFILSKITNIHNISGFVYVLLLLLGMILSIGLSSIINWGYKKLKSK